MQRWCKRCLSHEISQTDISKSINEYINSLSSEIKTDAHTFRKRLEKCRACHNLMNGMCRICGCFVEARAIKAVSYCPDVDRKW